MIINSVYLKNYRTHSEKFIEFDRGVNLLLGANGKGKSSILEAIGITLFQSTFRTGSRKGQASCVKFGEKTALVKIEFIGNDKVTYIIENQLKVKGSGFTKLYKKSDNKDILTISSEIKEKLKTLVGIKGDINNVYDNIIVAKQNNFINIYKENDKARQTTFDKVFNTDIYEAINKGHAKKTLDKYNLELSGEEKVLNQMTDSIEDIDFLKEELSKLITKEVKLKKIKEENDKRYFKVEKELTAVKELEKKIELTEKTISSHESIIINSLEELKRNSSNIENSKKAKKTVEDSSEDFESYNIFSKEEEIQSKILKEINTSYKKLEESKLKKEKLETSINKLKGESNTLKATLEAKVGEKEKLDEEIHLLKSKIQENLVKNSELEIKIKDFEELLIIINKLEGEIESSKKALVKEENNLELITNNFDNLKESLDSEVLKELLAKKEIKLKFQEDEKKLQNLISQTKALIKNNLEAKAKLATSICPFLSEKCKNLEGKDINLFFDEKEKSLELELKKYSLETKELQEKISSLKEIEKDIHNYESKLSQAKELEINLEKSKLKVDLAKKENEITLIKYNSFIKENSNKEEIITAKSKYRSEKESLNIEKDESQLKLLEEEISAQSKKITLLNEEISNTEEKTNNLKDESSKLQIEIEKLKEIPLKRKIQEEKVSKLKESILELQTSFELYMSNEASAKSLKNHLELKETLEERVNSEKVKQEKSLSLKVELINKLKENRKVEELKPLLDELKEKIDEYNKNLGEIIGEKENYSQRIEKNSKDQENIQKKRKVISTLRKKIELTQIFRNNIKNMGIGVSQGILERISFFATDNFRKITGRGEKVVWSNKNSPYEVTLVGGSREISFEQLSGGEQVAIAIAIRGAMSTLFTNTKFAIFDEPTNNLDIIRRKSLADNISEILKNLDQSIIVTHDNTFREMAQKTIEL